jgi:hypothetical protein
VIIARGGGRGDPKAFTAEYAESAEKTIESKGIESFNHRPIESLGPTEIDDQYLGETQHL